MDILCQIAKYKEDYIDLILCKLLDRLCLNKNLLDSKGLKILTKLCSVLPVIRVYIKFADVLTKVKDYEFIASTLNILDIFMLSYKETEPLRLCLKNLRKNQKDKKELKEFFEKIFRAWSFNPVSTLILCMMSEYFELSYYLILKL
jgi:vacuole morphology and inheritance protein 14